MSMTTYFHREIRKTIILNTFDFGAFYDDYAVFVSIKYVSASHFIQFATRCF